MRGSSPRMTAIFVLRCYELLPPISLCVEQCGEIAVVDAGGCGSDDIRLSMIGNAEPRRLDHGNVVCSIAGDENGVWRDAEPPSEFDQRGELRLAPEDR